MLGSPLSLEALSAKIPRPTMSRRPRIAAAEGIMADQEPETPAIAVNRKARHDYFIEDREEAGLALMGWEVKSLRAGRAQLAESYVTLRNGEAWLLGAHISPLSSASTHVETDPTRTRKLLLHRHQIDHLAGAVERRLHPRASQAVLEGRPRQAGNRSRARQEAA
jgi:hypothetical protein